MERADHHLIHKIVVSQGMVEPEQADACLRLVLDGAAPNLPDLLLAKGFLSPADHAILLRIFAPAPPPASVPGDEAGREEDADVLLEKLVGATGLLTVEFLEAAKETRRRSATQETPRTLHDVLLEEGYLTRRQLEGLRRGVEDAGYRCEGCGKPYGPPAAPYPERCPTCGIAVPRPGRPVSLELHGSDAGAAPAGRLTVLLGVNRGFVYELAADSRVTLGRQAANKIRLFGKQVSRRHCEIVPEGGGLTIRDLQSSFGTYVNGRAVGSHALHDGDLLKVGPTVLEFHAAAGPADDGAGAAPVEEILFGKIAVALKAATQRQVDEAVALQETTHRGRLLGQILSERRALDEGAVRRILEVQRHNLKSRGHYTDETTEKTLFGRIAVREGLVTEARLNEALRTQAKMESLSGISMRLGEILLRKGAMTPEGVQKVLTLQGRGELALPIPGYELVSKIGEGGMGAVFRARQRSLDREVAIKILHPRLSRDPFFIDRFLKEARAAAALSHENIIRAIDVGQMSGHHYFVMEFVQGQTAHDLVQDRGALRETLVLDIGIQVARALDHAHAHGIIHRDVKPENIMLTPDGVAKLCDLGLARSAAGGEGPEEAAGTPNYTSPEQARGDARVDIRTDIYSLGATLYHLATGTMPFKKLGPPLVVMARHLTEQIPHPRRLNARVSPGFAAVLTRMMVKDPRSRYPGPRDLLDDLLLVRAGRAPVNADTGGAVSTIAPP